MQTGCKADEIVVVDERKHGIKTRMGQRGAVAVDGRDAAIILAAVRLGVLRARLPLTAAMVILVRDGGVVGAMGGGMTGFDLEAAAGVCGCMAAFAEDRL